MIIEIDGKIVNVNEELLTEHLVITKRKYTDFHPQYIHSTYAPIRNIVLQNISKNGGKINKIDIDKLGIKPSWINKNTNLLNKKKTKNGIVFKLTKRANTILNKLHKNESLTLKYPLEEYLNEKNLK